MFKVQRSTTMMSRESLLCLWRNLPTKKRCHALQLSLLLLLSSNRRLKTTTLMMKTPTPSSLCLLSQVLRRRRTRTGCPREQVKSLLDPLVTTTCQASSRSPSSSQTENAATPLPCRVKKTLEILQTSLEASFLSQQSTTPCLMLTGRKMEKKSKDLLLRKPSKI